MPFKILMQEKSNERGPQ